MPQLIAVDLKVGLVADGAVHRRAVLREPTGRDEALLAELGQSATPAELIQAVLARLVVRIGDRTPPTAEEILHLTIGDRERLLLSLAAALLGRHVDLVTRCHGCRETLEVPVDLAELVTSAPGDDLAAARITSDAGIWTARLRPPTGTDLAAALAAAPDASSRALICACIVTIEGPDGSAATADDLPQDCEKAVAAALAELDPLADCTVTMACPGCSADITASIDGLTLLRTALGGDDLYAHVYRMARAYHWSEADILSLPVSRRRRYLAIAAAAEGSA